MPRPEPKKNFETKTFEFYYSDSDDKNTDNTSDINKSVKTKLEKISHIFRDTNTQNSYLPESFLELLQPTWDTQIVPVLVKKFGSKTSLYAIFYQEKLPEEVIIEVWNPNLTNQSSQVFVIRGVPNYEAKFFAKFRNEAPILVLSNWI